MNPSFLTLDKIHEDNPFIISVFGDFNAKSNNWCKNDITSHEGSMIDAVTSNYGLHQLIQEPTHILNSSSSCIDLIFTSQPNLVLESAVHSSLHPSSSGRLWKISFVYFVSTTLRKNCWFYKKANLELIGRAINEFYWRRALSNVSVDEKVRYFTETLLNIIHNFIPHERIACSDRNPPWINNEIKGLINEKNAACKLYCHFNRDVFLFEKFKVLQNQLNVSIENSKQSTTLNCQVH